MPIDWKWMSGGGVLLNGSGDIDFTDTVAGLQDMIRTRLKAALDGWKLYRIGAGLKALMGDAVTPELEVLIRRRVATSLNDYLPQGSFQIVTVPHGGAVDVLVYLAEKLVVTATVSRTGDEILVQSVGA